MSESSVAIWLNELRYSIEIYENASRPVSCADLAVILKRRGSMLAEIRRSLDEERADEMKSVCGKVRECDGGREEMEIKHAEICRVSTIFQECAEEEFVRPAVVDNYEVFVSKNVISWLSDLLCSSEDEEECDFEEFKRHLEKNPPTKSPTPSKFPVLEEDVQIRQKLNNNSFQTCRQTVHDFQGGSRSAVIIPPATYDIIVKGPLKMKDGGSNKYEKGSITLKIEQSSVIIEDNSKRKVIAKNLKMKSRTPTSIELVDGTNGSDKVLYRIQVENESQIEDHKRGRSNSLNEKQETKRIQNILKNLIKRRSDRYLLERKGIIKNEPIFGNTLTSIYQNCKDAKDPVPHFVQEIIKLIEIPKNMKSEHIYRISGNLATIQKIRLNLDKNKLEILKDFENETDVLTGTLKLFFRELKEPLIPRDKFAELHKFSRIEDEVKRNKTIKNVVNGIETPHKETLLALVQHLNKVVEYSEENKMTTHSLAIIWGPSLYWDEQPPNQVMMAFTYDVITVVEMLLSAYKLEPTTNETNRIENKLLAIGEESEDDDDEDEVKRSPGGIRRFFSNPRRLVSREFYGSNSSLSDAKKDEVVTLEALRKRTNTGVPDIIWRITEHIEKNLDTKDLYARAENKDKLAKCKKKAYKEKLDVSKIAVHDLASFLMSFLKELNQSLIPIRVFNDFGSETTKKDLEFKLETLDDCRRETLEHVLTHVLKVTDRTEINNMSKEKMVPIWAKTLYNSHDNSDYKKSVQLVEMLLEIYDDRRKHAKFAHNVNIKTHHQGKVEGTPDSGEKLGHKIWKGFAEDALRQKNERTMNVRQATFDNLDDAARKSDREARKSDPAVQSDDVKPKAQRSWKLVDEEASQIPIQSNLFKAKNESKHESKVCDSAVQPDVVKPVVREDVAKRRNAVDVKWRSVYDNVFGAKTTD